jgi:ketosteroid isomerase-like protein
MPNTLDPAEHASYPAPGSIALVAGAPGGEIGSDFTAIKPNLIRNNHMKTLTLLFTAVLVATPALAQEKKSTAKMNPEGAVRAMEERWEAAIQKHDAKTIGDLIASDFAGISPKNEFMTRSSVLDRLRKDTDTYSSTSIKGMKVRVYGPSAAVAIGDAIEKGTGKDGKAFDRTYRFTDTWVERNGQWQCVGEQVAQIAGSRAK